MKLSIKRLDLALPMPRYETAGSVAFDVSAQKNVIIAPKSIGLIPTGIVVCSPSGYAVLLASRSSTPIKKGLLTPHGIGIIDEDYCGPEDELIVQVYNFTDAPVTVERGERIAQCLIVKTERCELEEIETLENKTRGGFGSTG